MMAEHVTVLISYFIAGGCVSRYQVITGLEEGQVPVSGQVSVCMSIIS